MRDVFFRAWRRYRDGQPLEGIEPLIVDIALRHPEYHALLDNRARHANRDYLPEIGESNPFLHMGMHIAVEEQLSADRPAGVQQHFQALLHRSADPHAAQHQLMECLGETLWQAGRSGQPPSESRYLACLARLSGVDGVEQH